MHQNQQEKVPFIMQNAIKVEYWIWNYTVLTVSHFMTSFALVTNVCIDFRKPKYIDSDLQAKI